MVAEKTAYCTVPYTTVHYSYYTICEYGESKTGHFKSFVFLTESRSTHQMLSSLSGVKTGVLHVTKFNYSLHKFGDTLLTFHVTQPSPVMICAGIRKICYRVVQTSIRYAFQCMELCNTNNVFHRSETLSSEAPSIGLLGITHYCYSARTTDTLIPYRLKCS